MQKVDRRFHPHMYFFEYCDAHQLHFLVLNSHYRSTMQSSGKPTPGYILAHDSLLSTHDSQLSSDQAPTWNGSRSTNNRKGRPLVCARRHSPLLSRRLITSIKCMCNSSFASSGSPSPDDSCKFEGKIQRGTIAHCQRGAIVAPSKSMRAITFPESLSI